MQKRGQITVFVIIFLVVLITLALFYFTKSNLFDISVKGINIQKKLEVELNSIEKQIEECVSKETSIFLSKIADQGGFLEPTKYLDYKGKKISFLCQNIPNEKKCLNSMLSKEDLEFQLKNSLENKLPFCIGLDALKKRNEAFTHGDLRITSKINDKNINIKLELPLTLSKDAITLKKGEFNYIINSRLGKIIHLINKILNAEATEGTFGTTIETASSYGRNLVVLKQSSPHEVYKVSVIEEPDYIFYFAIENE